MRDVTVVDCCIRADDGEPRSRRPLYRSAFYCNPAGASDQAAEQRDLRGHGLGNRRQSRAGGSRRDHRQYDPWRRAQRCGDDRRRVLAKPDRRQPADRHARADLRGDGMAQLLSFQRDPPGLPQHVGKRRRGVPRSRRREVEDDRLSRPAARPTRWSTSGRTGSRTSTTMPP